MDQNKNNIQSLLRRYLHSQQGAVAFIAAMTVAFIIVPILALSLDVGGGYLMQHEQQNAASAASLASAIENGDRDEARQYFVANLPNGQHGISYDFDSDVAVNVTSGSVSVEPTRFERRAFFAPAMQPRGVAVIKSSASSIAALPNGAVVPASLNLVLDRSGSMKGNPIQQLRDATLRLVDKVAGLPNAQQDFSIAGVPWSSNVYNPFPYQNDFQDVRTKFETYLTAGGATCAQCGLHKAKEYLPLSPQNKKVVVFMTDGVANLLDPNISIPNGYPPGWNGGTVPTEFRAALWECSDIKADPDVTVWTIAFGQYAQGWPITDMLQYCASDISQYMYAPNGAAIDGIFSRIFDQIAKVRLVK